MSAVLKRGWCPTLDRPMRTGDGLLVRVQPRRATLTPHAARALAEAARRFGNGTMELTARGNLQLRGLRDDTVAPFAAAMDAAALPSPGPLLAPPLLGADPAMDPRTEPLVAALERAFAQDPRLAALPGKFAVAVDGGGLLGGRPVLADLVARPGGVLAPPPRGDAIPPIGRLGGHLGDGEASPFGLAPPLGALDAAMLDSLAGLAERWNTTIRVTPWRAMLLAAVPRAAAIEAPGWIADPADPRLLLSACPGFPGCAQGTVPARADAATMRPNGRLHVSGCAKGCAHPGPSPITLVGRAGRYDLVRNGRAGDTPFRTGLSLADASEFLAE